MLKSQLTETERPRVGSVSVHCVIVFMWGKARRIEG